MLFFFSYNLIDSIFYLFICCFFLRLCCKCVLYIYTDNNVYICIPPLTAFYLSDEYIRTQKKTHDWHKGIYSHILCGCLICILW